MVKELTREMLWEAGVQFGHQTKKWNPKMKPYIYGEKNKIHIIDLQQILWRIEYVKKLIESIATRKGKILFVGTKKQAKLIVKDAAERAECFYVNQRWLGGTLTNLKTIHLRVKRLLNIERQEKNGKLKLLSKKEQMLIKKEKNKLEKFLGGIKGMKELPQALFVVDPKEEHIAVREAQKLRIPIIAICDTNVDPDPIDYIIPANDDTSRSIAIITYHIADLYGYAMGINVLESQFKPNEFVRGEGKENRNSRNWQYDNRRSDIKNDHGIKLQHSTGHKPVVPGPTKEKKAHIELEQSVETEVTHITTAASFNLDTINVIDNDLEKTLSKLKVDWLEILSKNFSLPKTKKYEMVSELSKYLAIIDNKIVKKIR